ncbi:MAG: SAM-dependent methyltransferase [Pirellulaceae bacterium]
MHNMVEDQADTEFEDVKCCPSCAEVDYTDFFSFDNLPIHVGVFFGTSDTAKNAPTGDVTLSFCHRCGLVFNRKFDPELIAYEPGYEVALHHSAVFRSFMESVAQRLVEQYDVRGKRVFELGCGSGYFLKLLCELGANNGVGIDPTVSKESDEVVGEGRVKLIRDYFSDRYSYLDPEFVCCLSVFEHIPNPRELLQDLSRMLSNRDVPVYFEVFNAFRAFQEKETWSIHYEQCNYFSKDSLNNLFQRCGFDVKEASTCYEGGQYLYCNAVPRSESLPVAPLTPRMELPAALMNFGKTHQRILSEWSQRFAEMKARGERVVVWGTGGKGISFLNALKDNTVVENVVEINPDKQGKYVPGSGQLIVPPDFLASYQPHTVIITNPLYENEMKQQAQEMGVYCDFLIA